jgi:hypothetical protein
VSDQREAIRVALNQAGRAIHDAIREDVRADLLLEQADRRVADRRLSAKLKCPACGEYLSRVVDSRVFGDGADPQIRRRRVCENLDCKAKFTTIERVILSSVRKPA